MPTITEAYESREGDERGIGGTSAIRTFHVVTDSPGDDPIDALLADTTYNIRIGSLHPDENYAIFVSRLRKLRRITPTGWIVDVIYGIDVPNNDLLSPVGYAGWSIRMSSITHQEQLIHSVPYIDQEGVRIPPKLIGTPAYEKLPEASTGDYFVDDDEEGFDQTYFRRKAGVKKRYPQTRYSPRSSLTLSKSFESFSYQLTDPKWLSSFVGRVNRDAFLGLNVGACMFMSWSVDSRLGSVTGASQGYIFDITLNFELNFTLITDPNDRDRLIVGGHSPVQLVHIYEEEDGNSLQLRDTAHAGRADDRVLEEFHIAQGVEMSGIIEAIEHVHGNP